MKKLLACAAILAGVASAQEFEAASVKPAQKLTIQMMNSGQARFLSDNARFEESNASLRDLITLAYKVDWIRVTGPSWMQDEYFAVRATLPAGSTKDQIPAMLQKLLADRFKLSVHHDSRVESVYLLVVDPKGTSLKPLQGATAGDIDEKSRGFRGRPGQESYRGMTFAQIADNLSASAAVSATLAAMAQTGGGPADLAECRIDRPVVDQTGLTGAYDLDLQWIPPGGLGPGRPGRGANFPPRDPSVKADSIFGAFEALGLKLQPGKHTFDILVVDRVERVPTEN